MKRFVAISGVWFFAAILAATRTATAADPNALPTTPPAAVGGGAPALPPPLLPVPAPALGNAGNGALPSQPARVPSALRRSYQRFGYAISGDSGKDNYGGKGQNGLLPYSPYAAYQPYDPQARHFPPALRRAESLYGVQAPQRFLGY